VIFSRSMMALTGRPRVSKREPETPLRLEIAPGVIAAHASQTVVILEPINGCEVRVRDVASGTEKVVPVCELAGAALGLSRKDTQRRLEAFRGATRAEWLRARRRERVVMRLIRSDGDVAKQVTSASRALGFLAVASTGYYANTDKPLRPPAYSSVIAALRSSIGGYRSPGKPS